MRMMTMSSDSSQIHPWFLCQQRWLHASRRVTRRRARRPRCWLGVLFSCAHFLVHVSDELQLIFCSFLRFFGNFLLHYLFTIAVHSYGMWRTNYTNTICKENIHDPKGRIVYLIKYSGLKCTCKQNNSQDSHLYVERMPSYWSEFSKNRTIYSSVWY